MYTFFFLLVFLSFDSVVKSLRLSGGFQGSLQLGSIRSGELVDAVEWRPADNFEAGSSLQMVSALTVD